jgi:phosphoribosylaminoimidazolecarboxamide formyltransferase/IMP cyclohydrolase
MTPGPIKRALISVSDKTGIVEFARKLREWDVEIISTGGTLKTLRDAGVDARSVSDITGFPEILDGRVKTLHPKIHAGLLELPWNTEHMQQLAQLDITPIDMVVVNLYPFERTVAAGNVSLEEAVEQIDIGGPTMLRSAAKNYKYKTVVSSPDSYGKVISDLDRNNGGTSEEIRFELAQEVFLLTSRYDNAISGFFSNLNGAGKKLPDVFSLSLRKSEDLRYGENPHQQAALYGNFSAFFDKLHGKELSYNNIVDIQAAAELVEEFSEPTVVIIKHTNPCGAGSAPTLAEAYAKALATDTKSAFGGIVAVNRPLDLGAAQLIDKVFTEVIVAPDFPADTLEFLRKKKDRRLMKQVAGLRNREPLVVKAVAGGVLLQTPDAADVVPEQLRVTTKRTPTKEEHAAMMFGWRVAKHVKSNAIVYARPDRTIGIGAGQMSRFDSSRIAALKAQDAGLDLKGTSVASDAFFPFADGVLEAVKAGATAAIQPGGSIRDEEVIRTADEHDVAMVFTGIRHFRH